MPPPVDEAWLKIQAQISFERLLPRLVLRLASTLPPDSAAGRIFFNRLQENFAQLFTLFFHLYGQRYDFLYHLEELITTLGASWAERPPELQMLDRQREATPDWFLSNHMLGGVCYVDLFAGTLRGIRTKIPYFQELGLTYLHLMPLFKVPEDENDGGYAVSSYRDVNPSLGTMNDLRQLASELRRVGISLVVDFIFNHTSNEHHWAQKAREGDPHYRDFYYFFPDDTLPRAYQQTLRDIFPEQRQGSFTYYPELNSWIWTTFHSYQWDLNYSNPAVFTRMAAEILFLANAGVEVLRLDAVAFTWKQLGTPCENLPEAHLLIQAFNTATRIAAPSLLFKSEAIVHPDEVKKYIRPDECQISYNPLLMAMLWNTLATREVNLLHLALAERHHLPASTSWVNYLRSHDDIGWTFADEDASRLFINAYDHRRFLNAFYTGRFPGSFSRGLPFQENPRTGDVRISGTAASLIGLEKALDEESPAEVELAIRRILLVYGIILTIGGIPLIYLGDEVGTLNDYSYRLDPAKSRDSRWVHRPTADWAHISRRTDPSTIEGRIYHGLLHLITLRKNNPVFAGLQVQMMDAGSPHVLGYIRANTSERCLVFANFSEQEQTIPANILRLYGMKDQFTDPLSGALIARQDLTLSPYELRFLFS